MQALSDLPATASREVIATLCALPTPPVTDTQEARADAHAKDCLRLAVKAGTEAAEARRCRAQAISMMRQMQSGLRTLQRMQATKAKAEAAMQPAAMERAGYWFRDVSVPAPVAPPQAAAAPEPAIVDAIVNGTSPIMRALDQRQHAAAMA